MEKEKYPIRLNMWERSDLHLLVVSLALIGLCLCALPAIFVCN